MYAEADKAITEALAKYQEEDTLPLDLPPTPGETFS
jgi:hypothetical protein